jgi:hypothetical protein
MGSAQGYGTSGSDVRVRRRAAALCRRYVLGIFDATIAHVRESEGTRDQAVHWAFGWLADGECEPLGVWMSPQGGSDVSLDILQDLEHRGVERIWHVTGTDSGAVKERLIAAFSSTAVWPCVDELRSDAPPRRRPCLASSTERAAELFKNRLVRALRRHGSFESRAAVLDFTTDALQRAERRLDRERLIAMGEPRLDLGAQLASRGR